MKRQTSSPQMGKVFLYISLCAAFVFSFSCARQERKLVQEKQEKEVSQQQTSSRININTATKDDLAKLPTIGDEMAERIIEYRNRYGRFQRVEHLLLVRGMSDKKFRTIESLISVE